jgi:hypothetical protein
MALTLELAAPGWSTRLRQMADLIAPPAQRLDFQLLIGALAPRALELPTGEGAQALREALEDLWLNPRVMQRWSTLALTLGESGCLDLLNRASQSPHHGRGNARAMTPRQVKPRRWPAAPGPRTLAAA